MDLWVIDPTTGQAIGTGPIDSYVEAEFWRRMYEPGSFRITMETNDLAATGIDVDRFLWIQDDHDDHHGGHLFLIESITVDTADESPPVEITGRDVISAFMEHRVIVPPVGLAYDEVDDPVETVIYHYVSGHMGPDADAERILDNLTMAADLARGATIKVAGRHQTLLEFLGEIAAANAVGWEAHWDPDANAFEFEVLFGTDRTDTVFIDPEFETAETIRWFRSRTTSKNWALVAGQGEAELRDVETTYLGGAEPTGYDRRELFVDARDLEDVLLLPDRGQTALQETAEEDHFEIIVAPQGSFQYPADFDMADLVTIRSALYGLERSAQVVGVGQKASSEGGGAVTTTIQVGRVWPTLRRRVRSEVAGRPTASGRA